MTRYLAPEVITTTTGQTYDGKIADIWSCGVMLYVMLTGSYPFERQGDKTSPQRLQMMIGRILKVDYKFPSTVRPSDELQDLLDKMLTRDPADRITIAEIYEHPWFCSDLPPGVREMNSNMSIPTSGYQNEEEILAILREAETLPGAASRQSLDRQIDDAMTSDEL